MDLPTFGGRGVQGGNSLEGDHPWRRPAERLPASSGPGRRSSSPSRATAAPRRPGNSASAKTESATRKRGSPPTAAFPGRGQCGVLEAEVHRLRAENERLLQVRDILKKRRRPSPGSQSEARFDSSPAVLFSGAVAASSASGFALGVLRLGPATTQCRSPTTGGFESEDSRDSRRGREAVRFAADARRVAGARPSRGRGVGGGRRAAVPGRGVGGPLGSGQASTPASTTSASWPSAASTARRAAPATAATTQGRCVRIHLSVLRSNPSTLLAGYVASAEFEGTQYP